LRSNRNIWKDTKSESFFFVIKFCYQFFLWIIYSIEISGVGDFSLEIWLEKSGGDICIFSPGSFNFLFNFPQLFQFFI
jgi:uncharacterized protein with PQ loop repeat